MSAAETILASGTSAGVKKSWLSRQHWSIGRGGSDYYKHSVRDSKGEIVARFKDKKSAHEHAAALYEASGNKQAAEEHRQTASYVKPEKPEEQKLIDSLKRKGVRDVVGALADHYYDNEDFAMGVLGDKVYDLANGDKSLQKAIHIHNSSLPGGIGKASKKLAKIHDSAEAYKGDHNKIEGLAQDAVAHVDETAGDMANDHVQLYGGSHRSSIWASHPVSMLIDSIKASMSNRITTILGTPTQVDVILGGAPVGNRNAAGHGHSVFSQALSLRKLANQASETAYNDPLQEGHHAASQAHLKAAAAYYELEAGNHLGHQPDKGLGGDHPNTKADARKMALWHSQKAREHSLAGREATKNRASTTHNDDTITAAAADYIVTARFATSQEILDASTPASAKPWKQGEETKFMYMPDGIHTIYAGFRKKTIGLTVKVVKDEDAQVCASSFNRLTAAAPKQKPFGCIEHEEKDASFWPKGFEAGPDGVYATAEPSALGETHVNGKIHRSFSPSFFTDADYSKAVLSKDETTYNFPDGVRGSASNPARVTGVAFCVGTLTNNPAFREMSPVKAKQGIMNLEEEQINAKKNKEPQQNDEAAVERQVQLSTRAFSASERAINGCYGSDRVKCHMDAAKAHERAEAAHEDVHPSGSKHHGKVKEYHINKAAEIADEASDRADQQTKITEAMEGHSASPQLHKEASELHSMAAEAQEHAGNMDKANEHREQMQEHDKAAGQVVRSAAEILAGDTVRAGAPLHNRNASHARHAYYTVSHLNHAMGHWADDDQSPLGKKHVEEASKHMRLAGYSAKDVKDFKVSDTKDAGKLINLIAKDFKIDPKYQSIRNKIEASQPRTAAEILASNGN